MNGLVGAALDYARRGWRVFPLHGIVNGRCTCGRRDCSSPGKHPLVRQGLHEATRDPHVIKEWWRPWRRANIAIATGRRSGIVVIDIDLPLAIQSLPALVHKLPRTLTTLTGGGGIHLLLRAPEDRPLHNHASRLPGLAMDLPGIDLRAEGGYIVAPPSLHSSGRRYEWLELAGPVQVEDPNGRDERDERDERPDDDPFRHGVHSITLPTPIAPPPVWLCERERVRVSVGDIRPADFQGDGSPYGLAVLRAELARLRTARVGTRNHHLNRSAFALAQLVAGGELVEAAARSSLLIAARSIGLTEPEIRQTINSAFEAGFSEPRAAPHRLRRQCF